MNEEVWKDVVGFEGLYRVSSKGRVKSVKTGKILNPYLRGRCLYYSVQLYKNSKPFNCNIHRIFAIAFLSNPKNKKEVNHINGIKTDNRIENLEWVTHKENIHHAINTGLLTFEHIKGEQHYCCKLKESDVIFIRKQYSESKGTRKQNGTAKKSLAEKYGVSSEHINSIVKRKCWKEIYP